jgi:hypothetical protein
MTGKPDLSAIRGRRLLSAEVGGTVEILDCAITNVKLQIRMVAGYREVAERKRILVAGACNVPNALIVPFRIKLPRPAA